MDPLTRNSGCRSISGIEGESRGNVYERKVIEIFRKYIVIRE